MSKWIHSHKSRISLTVQAFDIIQTLLEKGEKLNWAEFWLGKILCKNEKLRFLLNIHLRKLFRSPSHLVLRCSGALLCKGMTSMYTRLSCCILIKQHNKLQMLMHIVRENIHGTAPGSLTFKEGRIKSESDRCIAVPVPSWFSKRTKISFLYLFAGGHAY